MGKTVANRDTGNVTRYSRQDVLQNPSLCIPVSFRRGGEPGRVSPNDNYSFEELGQLRNAARPALGHDAYLRKEHSGSRWMRCSASPECETLC